MDQLKLCGVATQEPEDDDFEERRRVADIYLMLQEKSPDLKQSIGSIAKEEDYEYRQKLAQLCLLLRDEVQRASNDAELEVFSSHLEFLKQLGQTCRRRVKPLPVPRWHQWQAEMLARGGVPQAALRWRTWQRQMLSTTGIPKASARHSLIRRWQQEYELRTGGPPKAAVRMTLIREWQREYENTHSGIPTAAVRLSVIRKWQGEYEDRNGGPPVPALRLKVIEEALRRAQKVAQRVLSEDDLEFGNTYDLFSRGARDTGKNRWIHVQFWNFSKKEGSSSRMLHYNFCARPRKKRKSVVRIKYCDSSGPTLTKGREEKRHVVLYC